MMGGKNNLADPWSGLGDCTLKTTSVDYIRKSILKDTVVLLSTTK
jgi:hypothetical protein